MADALPRREPGKTLHDLLSDQPGKAGGAAFIGRPDLPPIAPLKADHLRGVLLRLKHSQESQDSQHILYVPPVRRRPIADEELAAQVESVDHLHAVIHTEDSSIP